MGLHISSSIRDTFLGFPKVFLSVHRGLILTSSSPVSDVHIIKLCISIETRIAKRWFVFEAFEPATVIIGVSDMSMVRNPQSMNIITAHEPAVVIISRFWYIQDAI
ncbi:hypothetical protein DPMN_021889 [Dreissena polymorpha]|uniref:Uncharacterized protein n=1 Tax=Dreissena polymorpha TaxID=45954 RepID=A0A9D4NLK6_DREPO|nr:hypothetical protein DPMN_021889 [Dreissena polymorpha]